MFQSLCGFAGASGQHLKLDMRCGEALLLHRSRHLINLVLLGEIQLSYNVIRSGFDVSGSTVYITWLDRRNVL